MKLLPISLLGLGTLLAVAAVGYAVWGNGSGSRGRLTGESFSNAATVSGAPSAPPWRGLVGTWHNEYKVTFQPGKEVTWDTTITYDENFDYRAVARINATILRHSGSWRVEGDQLKYVRKACNVEGSSTDMAKMCSSNDSPSAQFELKGDVLEIRTEQSSAVQKFDRVASR